MHASVNSFDPGINYDSLSSPLNSWEILEYIRDTTLNQYVMDVFSSIECDTILSDLLVALKLWPKVEREDVSKKNKINVHLIYLVQANFSVNNIQKHSVIALYICLIKIFFIFLYFSTICMPKLLEFYLIFKKLNPTVRLFTFSPLKNPFFEFYHL